MGFLVGDHLSRNFHFDRRIFSPHNALARALEVVAGYPLAEFERVALSLIGTSALPIHQKLGELLRRLSLQRKYGATVTELSQARSVRQKNAMVALYL